MGEQGLGDDSLKELQGELLRNPECGDVMRGAGGFRKMRFAMLGRGKSRSLRVIYLDVQEYSTIYLVLAYHKSEKDTLSPTECAELKQIAKNIKVNLGKRNG